MHTNVHSSVISNSPKLETTQMTFKRWKVKTGCGSTIPWILPHENQWTIYTCNNLDVPQGNFAQWEKPISNGYVLNDFSFIMIVKWHNYPVGEQIGGCPWWEMGWRDGDYKGLT